MTAYIGGLLVPVGLLSMLEAGAPLRGGKGDCEGGAKVPYVSRAVGPWPCGV